jgi:hypothetical protein
VLKDNSTKNEIKELVQGIIKPFTPETLAEKIEKVLN